MSIDRRLTAVFPMAFLAVACTSLALAWLIEPFFAPTGWMGRLVMLAGGAMLLSAAIRLALLQSAKAAASAERYVDRLCELDSIQLQDENALEIVPVVVAAQRLLDERGLAGGLERHAQEKGPPGHLPAMSAADLVDAFRGEVAVGRREVEIEVERRCHETPSAVRKMSELVEDAVHRVAGVVDNHAARCQARFVGLPVLARAHEHGADAERLQPRVGLQGAHISVTPEPQSVARGI